MDSCNKPVWQYSQPGFLFLAGMVCGASARGLQTVLANTGELRGHMPEAGRLVRLQHRARVKRTVTLYRQRAGLLITRPMLKSWQATIFV